MFAALFLVGAIGLAAMIAISLDEQLMQPGQWSSVFILLVFVSLLVAGTVGVLYSVLQVGTSAERRSVLASRASSLEMLMDGHGRRTAYPTLPAYENFTNSPGVELAYRLPMDFSPGWTLLALATFCLAWNATAAILMGLGIRELGAESTDWIYVLFVTVFVAIGIWSAHFFIQRFSQATAIGPTGLEISDHPVLPGSTYQVYVTQAGRLNMRVLEIRLVCDEEATYRQGTDIRTESRRIYEEPILRAENFAIKPEQPFGRQDTFSVPGKIMHSFQAPHNSIQWKILVTGEAEGWPRFERTFPIVVYPSIQRTPSTESSAADTYGTPHQHPAT